MSLTADRKTSRREGQVFDHPVAEAATIFQGALTVLNGGFAEPGSTALGLVAAGVARGRADNSAGGDGDISVQVERGTFRFDNSGADAIDRSDIGGTAYIVDDHTVAATDGTGTRSAAGEIVDLDDYGVWVKI